MAFRLPAIPSEILDGYRAAVDDLDAVTDAIVDGLDPTDIDDGSIPDIGTFLIGAVPVEMLPCGEMPDADVLDRLRIDHWRFLTALSTGGCVEVDVMPGRDPTSRHVPFGSSIPLDLLSKAFMTGGCASEAEGEVRLVELPECGMTAVRVVDPVGIVVVDEHDPEGVRSMPMDQASFVERVLARCDAGRR